MRVASNPEGGGLPQSQISAMTPAGWPYGGETMQTVYATHLPLPDQPDGTTLDSAAAVLVGWVRSRFDVQMSPLSGGSQSQGWRRGALGESSR